MKTVIVCSVTDCAGTNIRERLLESFPFEATDIIFDRNPVYRIGSDISLVSSRQSIIFVDHLDDVFHPNRAVFISRHYAESGIPSLTAHFTGNFGKADFGGNPGEISRYSPYLLKTYMQNLKTKSQDIASRYNITLEATHHGPTALKSTVLFVELGSTEIQWIDVNAAAKIAKALIETLRTRGNQLEKCAVCIGGTHYSEKFNNALFNSEFGIGPIVPKHALEYFSSATLKQIMEKSDQPVSYAIIDRKGLGKFKENVMRVVDDSGLEKILV